jgi:hypothetical protein
MTTIRALPNLTTGILSPLLIACPWRLPLVARRSDLDPEPSGDPAAAAGLSEAPQAQDEHRVV